ncbi:MAG: phosphomannomutase/phosphoglucomutase [Patescibacteria group bacterium]
MVKVNPKIFHQYDIRGVYPDDFNEEVAKQIGRIFVDYTKAKKILIGRDVRLSGQKIFDGLAQGLTEMGADVFDAGLVPIDFVYSMTVKNRYDAGIMITASHNPKEYNGLKMFKYVGKPWIEWINGSIFKEIIDKKLKPVKKIGKIRKVDHWQNYIDHIFSFVEKNKIKPLKIVVDAGNSVAAKVILLIEKDLPSKFIHRFFDLDGNFPNRSPNSIDDEVLEKLGQEVLRKKADFGVAFDGDADRIVLVDEKGEPLLGDCQILLLAKEILENYPGATIVYNLMMSRAVPEIIKKMGGRAVKSKVGFCFIMQTMRENNGIMGGEHSCHFSFKDNFYADSGMIAFLKFIEVISSSGKKVSELVKDYKIYKKIYQPSIKVEDKEKTFENLKKKYQDGKIDELDGLTIEYDDWWFNIRPSNTEPVIRLTVEAKTKELLEKKLKEIKSLIV